MNIFLSMFLFFSVMFQGQEYRYPITSCTIDPLLGAVTVAANFDGCFDSGNTVKLTQNSDNPAGDNPTGDNPAGDNSTGETPVTNTCKNQNAGKDGTSNECNAGHGQEKHGG